MMLKKASALFLALFAFSLLAFGLLGLSLSELFRMVAVSLGLSIIYAVFWPRIRGVKEGDSVVVVSHSFMPSFLGRKGTILSPARRQNQEVRVLLDSGVEVIGVLESFEELLSPPRVRLLYEERMSK